MADKTVTVRVRAETQAATNAVRNLGVALKGAAQQGMAMRRGGGFVSAEMSGHMRAFNERTERARQLLVVFGGAMGAAGGQAVYYAGTILYIYGMFTKLQLGIMAGIGVLAMLGKAIYDSATRPLKEMRKGLKDAAEEADQLSKSLASSSEQAILSSAGWTKWEIRLLDARRKLADVTERILLMEAERNRIMLESDSSLGGLASGVLAEKLNEEIMAARAKLFEGELAMGAARIADIIEQARRDKKGKGGGKGGGATEWELEVNRANTSDYELLFGMLVPRGTTQQMIDDALRRMDYYQATQQMQQIDWQQQQADYRRQQLGEVDQMIDAQMAQNARRFDKEAELEEKRYDAMEDRARKAASTNMELASMSANAIVDFARAIAAGNMEAIGEQLKGMAIQAAAKAAWHGIMAVAAAFFNPVQAGQHATLAAMFAGFAATYGAVGAGLASAGGGGGGGAASGGYADQSYTPQREEQEPEKQTIVINVQGSYFESSEAGRELWERQQAWQNRQSPGATRGAF